MAFPDVIKSWTPSTRQALVRYLYRGYGNPTVSSGITSMRTNQIGRSNVVYCTRNTGQSYRRNKKGQNKPQQVRLNRFAAWKVEQGCSTTQYKYEPGPYPKPMTFLDGPIAGMSFKSVPVKDLVVPASAWRQDLADLSLMKAYTDMRGVDIGVGLMLAEATETLRMLRNPMQNFGRLYNDWVNAAKFSGFAGRSGRKAQALLDALSSTWLSYQYGISPLISDIEAIAKGVSEKLSADILYRCKGKSPKETTTTSVVLAEQNTLDLWIKWRETTTTVTRGHTRLYFNLSSSATPLSLMLDSLGLSPELLPVLVYEKIPYSFVLDWVWNFGLWLEAVTPAPNYNVLGLCTSVKTEIALDRTCEGVRSFYANMPAVGLIDSLAWSRVESLDRRINLPFPSLPPLLNRIVGFRRVASALSLFWQRLPKLKRA